MKYCLHRDKLMSATANPTILISKILYCHACRTDLERRAGRISAKRGRKSRVRRLRTKQKQGAPTRTHPEKSTYDSDMYNRAFPVGNALFFFAWDMMSLAFWVCSSKRNISIRLQFRKNIVRKQGLARRRPAPGSPGVRDGIPTGWR